MRDDSVFVYFILRIFRISLPFEFFACDLVESPLLCQAIHEFADLCMANCYCELESDFQFALDTMRNARCDLPPSSSRYDRRTTRWTSRFALGHGESVLLKHQLLILNRSRRRAPNLRAVDRFSLVSVPC
jgi:hypothetical protein